MDLEQGYYWSTELTAPTALIFENRANNLASWISAGNYDFSTVPFGDNWTYKEPASFTSVKMNEAGCLSVKPRFGIEEPSAGFLILMRGPYNDNTPEASRGDWKLCTYGAGMVFGRIVLPVFGHSGHRWNRWHQNGIPVITEGNFWPALNTTWWGNKNPVGPPIFWSKKRVAIQSNLTPPDVTKLCCIPDKDVYVAICWIDMLGRESVLSPVLKINKSNTGLNTFIQFRREYSSVVGASAVRIYAGYSPDNLHRQPVLDYVGSTPNYNWPINLQNYTLNSVVENNIRYNYEGTCASILCQPQQDVVDGKMLIEYNQSDYKLYCPFFLPYDYRKFGRIIGKNSSYATFTHQDNWNGQSIVKEIPLCFVNNQRDEFYNANFVSFTAFAGLTFSDWSGGQSFSNRFNQCNFSTYAPESYGFLIAEQSSRWFGDHTTSETVVKSCKFTATIPVNVEGNQTAKIRFKERCGFAATGLSRYGADTAIFYVGSPNTFIFDEIEGIFTRSDKFLVRSLVSIHSRTGYPKVILKDLFVDTGIPVFFTFYWYETGMVSIKDGERINFHSQQWCRIAENPGLATRVDIQDTFFTPVGSSISFNLNQLNITSNSDLGEVVRPTTTDWIAKGMPLKYAEPSSVAYYDFSAKAKILYNMGFSDKGDTTKVLDITKVPAPVASV